MHSVLPYNERVLRIHDAVTAVFGTAPPFSVRLAAARAADKVVTDWAAARKEDDAG